MSLKTLVPRFDDYIYIGDSVSWVQKGFDMKARIDFDAFSKPTDYDCYGPKKISDWKRGKWFYAVIVVTASKAGIELGSDSLGGVEINSNKTANRRLHLFIEDSGMPDIAIENAKKVIEALTS